MKIGLTYDLRREYLAAGYGEEETAEFDSQNTIDSLDGALRRLGHETDHIGNARQLVQRLARGDRWELVFNICEGLRGPGREAQVPALLDLYEIPYTFSDPLVMSLSLHKSMMKAVARDAGLPTAPSALIEHPGQLCRTNGLHYPLLVKPVAEGTSKGISPASRVTDPSALELACRRLLEEFRQPALVEEFLPGREFTVGLLGTGEAAQVLGTLEILLGSEAEPGVYSYTNKEQSEDLVDYWLADSKTDDEVRQAEEVALAVWRVLGGRDAGRVDLRSDAAGRPQFLEVNPLSGLNPLHSDLPQLCTAVGIPYLELIERIVRSAQERAANGSSGIWNLELSAEGTVGCAS